MKKVFLFLFAAVLLIGLAACGGDKPDKGGFDYDAIPDTMEATSYEIAFVTDIGQLKDKSFNQGTWEGLKRFASENNKSYKYYQPANGNNATDDDRYNAMKAAVDGGAKIVVCAGLINALKVVKKEMKDVKVVINGAGSAGISICKLVLQFGVGDVVLVDKDGALCPGQEWMNPAQKAMAEITNKSKQTGPLKEIIKDKDVFIGVSAPNLVSAEMVQTMAKDPVIFAMANPTPEVMPDVAKEGGAKVVATGRSDFPNQINNVLVFPGIFRGALDVRAKEITEEMKIAAAKAIASLVTDEELTEDYIIPSPFDTRVCNVVAKEVGRVAREQGIARI